ncbi:MAG: CDP-diacylglycerol--glycerol-3-phosphate 3-phosphatidyltransferase [Erysipelotrichaceae bacterium]
MIFPFGSIGVAIPEYQIGVVSIGLINIIVLVLFCVASFTDYLDGYIARKNHLVTSFGKFIDPIADKLLVNTMFVMFAATNIIPVAPVLLMIWRDTIVDGLRMNAAQKGKVVAAGMLGKIKTVAQMATIVTILLNNLPFELVKFPMSHFLLWFATIISVLSGIVYFIQLKDIVLESK